VVLHVLIEVIAASGSNRSALDKALRGLGPEPEE
jgi:hypothetical protein